MKNIKPPTLGEVIELRQQKPNSLESAAASINRHIDLFSRAEGSWQAHRVRAGFELIAVRKRIDAGEWEGGWEAWCAEHIHRSYRDIQKMMALARTGDPEAAAAEERAKRRKGMQAHRAAHVGRPVEHVFQLFLQLDADQRAEFLALVRKEMEP